MKPLKEEWLVNLAFEFAMLEVTTQYSSLLPSPKAAGPATLGRDHMNFAFAPLSPFLSCMEAPNSSLPREIQALVAAE